MNVTQWFTEGEKPVHVGVYQRQTLEDVSPIREFIWYSYWNGLVWSPITYSVADAIEERHIVSNLQGLPWRGIAKEVTK